MKKITLVLFFIFTSHLFSQLNLNIFSSNDNCVGGKHISYQINGGTSPYMYQIYLNNTLFNTPVTLPVNSLIFSNDLNAGNYRVVVTDVNSLSTYIDFVVVAPDNLGINLTYFDGGATRQGVTIDGIGGKPPYNYYSIHDETNNVYVSTVQNTLLLPGNYTARIGDSNGCYYTTPQFKINNIIKVVGDDFSGLPINSNLGGVTKSVFANDTFNGVMPNQSNVILSSSNIPVGLTLNRNGTIGVAPGTPPATYVFNYNICDVLYPTVCKSTIVNVTVVDTGLVLKSFLDTNNNGIKDNGEQSFNDAKFRILKNSTIQTDVIAPNGVYVINDPNINNQSNVYNFGLILNYPYYTANPGSYVFIQGNPNGNAITYNFPVTITQLFNDLSVSILPIAQPKPGFTYKNEIVYTNNGNQTISLGTLSFTKDNLVSIISNSQSGVTSTPTGFSYVFTNLQPFESRSIIVTMQVPTIPTIAIGGLLTNSASVSPIIGDVNLLNDTSISSQIIVGSFDPNDKMESHGKEIQLSSFTSNDYLNYTIRFENTGTADASFINVTDILDAKLDETSIKMVKASNSYTLTRIENNLNWNFDNVQLPPSVANTQIGHGYISFQIKPKLGYKLGDIIPNIANIYFDFNPVIVTETCNSKFISTLSNNDFVFNKLKSYPNPANDIFTIENESVIDSVVIFSVLGQKMIDKNVNGLTTEISLKELSNGIYFIKIMSSGIEKVIKIMKD